MDVFQIIGPIMVGPSSSHTAGAVKIGNVVRDILGEPIIKATIILHGSFGKTYRGHGTDKAIIAGLMGIKMDDDRIRNALKIADKDNLKYDFIIDDIKDAHPNTAQISVLGIAGNSVNIQASSIGGGIINIDSINDIQVNFNAEQHTLIIFHKDTSGAVASVIDPLAAHHINIGKMDVYRTQREGDAVMIIETDQQLDEKQIKYTSTLPNINKVSLVKGFGETNV